MRIDANAGMINIAPTVTIEHLGNTLTFSISCYRKNRFNAGFDVFAHINDYWADQSPENQQAIYNIYAEIFTLFDNLYTKESLKEGLKHQINELFKYHDLNDVQRWIAFRGRDIRIPPDIPVEFIADPDRNTTVGKTYVVSEYLQLRAFSMVLRCMIPIWGEYIFSIKKNTDENFREMQAFQLVDDVFTLDLPVISKLTNYIDNFVISALGNKDAPKATSVFKGISSADYTRWLSSLVMIYCLSVGDIRGSNPDAHLVTYIHIYINTKLSPKEEFGDSKIKEKEIVRDSDEDSRVTSSALERYKIKANISIGDVVEIEQFLSDPYHVAELLAPGIDRQDVADALNRIKEYTAPPTVPQMTLMRWLMSTIVPPQIHLYMPENLIKSLLAVSEVVLWARDHKYLAVLITCQPVVSANEMVVTIVDSKMRIPDVLIKELDELFPFRQNERNKKTNLKDSNFAMLSIDALTNEFINFGWRPTRATEKNTSHRSVRYVIKPDIKTDFARLVIELQKMRRVGKTY